MFKIKPALTGFLACLASCLVPALAAAQDGASNETAAVSAPLEPIPAIELKDDPPPLATIDLTLPPYDL